jgi:hypothetical protein
MVACGLRRAYLKELWIWRRALKRPSRRVETNSRGGKLITGDARCSGEPVGAEEAAG